MPEKVSSSFRFSLPQTGVSGELRSWQQGCCWLDPTPWETNLFSHSASFQFSPDSQEAAYPECLCVDPGLEMLGSSLKLPGLTLNSWLRPPSIQMMTVFPNFKLMRKKTFLFRWLLVKKAKNEYPPLTFAKVCFFQWRHLLTTSVFEAQSPREEWWAAPAESTVQCHKAATSIVQYNYLDFLVTLVLLLRPGNIYKQTVKV